MWILSRKVQILYTYLPGAIFPHEEYGQCLVSTIDINELLEVNRDALAEVVAGFGRSS